MRKPLSLTRLLEELARFVRRRSQRVVMPMSKVQWERDLDAALEEGERSGDAEDGVFERLRARMKVRLDG